MKLFKPARNLIRIVAHHPKFFAFILFCALVAAPAAYAQYSLDSHQEALGAGGQNLQKFSEQNFAGFINSANIALSGCVKENNNCPNELKTGAIPITTTMVASLYANPPASGVTYFADILHHINPVQQAYAQTTGTGFGAFSPILPVWKAFRNFAYAFFAIVFIFIGLAIMFRMKLDPRTTLTIQSAIPRIVIALLLVTFSYAIAGLMVDLLYVMIAIVALIFGSIPEYISAQDLQTEFINGGFWQLTGRLFSTVFCARDGGTGVGVAGLVAGGLVAAGSLLFLGITALTALGIVGLGVAVVVLVLSIIVLYLLFKLFFELLKAYIFIILGVVFGPLQIAMGVIPGLPGAGDWFKNLFINILIFPAVAFVLILGQILIRHAGQNLWMPPMLGGTLVSGAIPFLIGLGMLMIAHQVPQAIRNVFARRPMQFAPGEATNLIRTPIASGAEGQARASTSFTGRAIWGTIAGATKPGR